jgi:pimeloyl-ACP methyl ester carboxylesterase
MWQPQWETLQQAGFQTLRPDFRGFGDTPAPSEPYSNAEDVRDLLDSLGLDRVALVGSSFGGRIAQEFAARWPSRVTSLALVCAAMRGFPPTPDAIEFSDAEDALIERRDLDGAADLNVRTFLGPSASAVTRSLVAQMQRRAFEIQIDAPDVEQRVVEFDHAAITARTLVVSGDHDLEQFGQIADVLAERIPSARRVSLDWAGHLPSLEDPARFNPLLLDFLRGA